MAYLPCKRERESTQMKSICDEQDGGEGTAVTLPGSTGTVCVVVDTSWFPAELSDVRKALLMTFSDLRKDLRVCTYPVHSLSQCSQVPVGI